MSNQQLICTIVNCKTGSTSSVTKRGKAKNNTLINHIARRGQKPRIEIPPGKSKPVGDWSQQFASEVGIICREHAPLSLYNWRKVKKEYKSKVQTMHEHILVIKIIFFS